MLGPGSRVRAPRAPAEPSSKKGAGTAKDRPEQREEDPPPWAQGAPVKTASAGLSPSCPEAFGRPTPGVLPQPLGQAGLPGGPPCWAPSLPVVSTVLSRPTAAGSRTSQGGCSLSPGIRRSWRWPGQPGSWKVPEVVTLSWNPSGCRPTHRLTSASRVQLSGTGWLLGGVRSVRFAGPWRCPRPTGTIASFGRVRGQAVPGEQEAGLWGGASPAPTSGQE